MEVRENSERLQNGTDVLDKSQGVDMTSVEKRASDRMERNYFLTLSDSEPKSCCFRP